MDGQLSPRARNFQPLRDPERAEVVTAEELDAAVAQCRAEGNGAFRSGNYRDAVAHYAKTIAALLHAERPALLRSLKQQQRAQLADALVGPPAAELAPGVEAAGSHGAFARPYSAADPLAHLLQEVVTEKDRMRALKESDPADAALLATVISNGAEALHRLAQFDHALRWAQAALAIDPAHKKAKSRLLATRKNKTRLSTHVASAARRRAGLRTQRDTELRQEEHQAAAEVGERREAIGNSQAKKDRAPAAAAERVRSQAAVAKVVHAERRQAEQRRMDRATNVATRLRGHHLLAAQLKEEQAATEEAEGQEAELMAQSLQDFYEHMKRFWSRESEAEMVNHLEKRGPRSVAQKLNGQQQHQVAAQKRELKMRHKRVNDAKSVVDVASPPQYQHHKVNRKKLQMQKEQRQELIRHNNPPVRGKTRLKAGKRPRSAPPSQHHGGAEKFCASSSCGHTSRRGAVVGIGASDAGLLRMLFKPARAAKSATRAVREQQRRTQGALSRKVAKAEAVSELNAKAAVVGEKTTKERVAKYQTREQARRQQVVHDQLHGARHVLQSYSSQDDLRGAVNMAKRERAARMASKRCWHKVKQRDQTADETMRRALVALAEPSHERNAVASERKAAAKALKAKSMAEAQAERQRKIVEMRARQQKSRSDRVSGTKTMSKTKRNAAKIALSKAKDGQPVFDEETGKWYIYHSEV